MTRVIDRPVLVLNKQWQPVAVFDVATAITTVVRDMGHVLDGDTFQLHTFETWRSERPASAHYVRTPSGEIPAPEIIVLSEYEELPRRRVSFNRRNLYRRDDHRCQYCGLKPALEELTIDHVSPRSKGGALSLIHI